MKQQDLIDSLREMTDIVTRRINDDPGPDDVAARWDRARDLLAKCDQSAFRRHLDRASDVVATWPGWKRRLLGGN